MRYILTLVNYSRFILLLSLVMISACSFYMGNINGPSANYPFYITKKPLTIKNILVPAGAKLDYEEQFLKEGEQTSIMQEKKLTTINFPKDKPFYWAGIPVKFIVKFFNPEMIGYTLYPDFEKIKNMEEKTNFVKLLEVCGSDVGITVRDGEDWSFNKENIADIENCSVTYQRFFKNDKNQQKFLDVMYQYLMEVDKETN